MKTSRFFTMALCAMVVAMGATSCRKDDKGIAGDRMTIGANIGQHGGDGAKTVIGDETGGEFPILWSDGDAFTLYSKNSTAGTTFGITSGAGSESAVFEGVNPGDAPYFASYPAAEVTRTDETIFTYEIPQDQSDLNHAGPMVGYSADGQSVDFENAASWVRIGLKGNAKVTKVEMSYSETKAAPKPLSGTLTITVDESGKISSTSVAQSLKAEAPKLYRTCDVTLAADYHYFDFLVPEGAFGGSTVAKFKVFGTDDAVLATFEKEMPAIQRNKVYVGVYETAINEAPATPKFSVGENTTVEFAPGNLYYNGEDDDHKMNSNLPSGWNFYGHQWNCYPSGTSSVTESMEISLFTWGYGTWSKVYNTTTYQTGSGVTMTDWGSLAIGSDPAGTWRTLTNAEWRYLLGIGTPCRDNASSLRKWKELDGGTHKGLVILPDGTDASVMESIASVSDLATYNAVFLPASGYRSRTGVYTLGSTGSYWSSTPKEGDEGLAFSMNFSSGNVLTYGDDRDYGDAVRLVRDITE